MASAAEDNLEILLPQIAWHVNGAGTQAIQSVDASPTSNFVATAGNDNEVHMWKIGNAAGAITFVQALTGHTMPVNIVRFSPDGLTLASAGIDMQIMLWRERAGRPQAMFGGSSSSAGDGSTQWAAVGVLRGHTADVHALTWSPSADGLFSGDVSGTTIVWNLKTAKPHQIVTDHENYVHGVAWDPCDEHLVSVACDQTVRLYSSNPTKKAAGKQPAAAQILQAAKKPVDERDYTCHTVLAKRTASFTPSAPPLFPSLQPKAAAGAAATPATPATPAAPDSASSSTGSEATVTPLPRDGADVTSKVPDSAVYVAPSAGPAVPPPAIAKSLKPTLKKEVNLFLDDTVISFYRRPDWSPDGSFLLVPCGQYYADNAPPPSGEPMPTTHVFARHNLTQPCAHLPSPSKPVVAVRCSPVLYEHISRESAVDLEKSSAFMGSLPYRVLWAAITLDSIIVYDSSLPHPLFVASNTHLAPLTDVAWLPNGNGLICSSDDGYCTMVRFRPGALGTPLPADKLPQCMRKQEASAAAPQVTASQPTILQVRKKPKLAEAPPAAPAPPPAAPEPTILQVRKKPKLAEDVAASGAASDAAPRATIAPVAASASSSSDAPPAASAEGGGEPAVKKARRIVPTPMPLS